MEWVETTAKTVEEAKDLALDRLGVDEQDAEFEVLEVPRPGLFGRTRGEGRVRARVRPVQPRPKAERREKRRPPRGAGSRPAKGSRPDEPAGEVPQTEPEEIADDETIVGPAPRPSGRGGRGRNAASSGADAPVRGRARKVATPAEPASSEEPTMNEDVTVEEQGEMIQEFLEGLVDAFGFEAEVGTTRVDDETVEVHVEGSDLGLLVGPKGATLQAIHDLSRTVVQRRASGHHEGRVRIDVAGYREKRREALERFTQKVAAEVVAAGVAKVLEPMAPADRKVVHDTANSIDGVHTSSEGDEPRRRVVILPD
ncbi:MAG: Jag N-terminal domain-containing protein [Acidimicrobiia bacterium]|nr:Jag N-terminal domain-containing protein [Acidimicrobiia bacterium]